MVYGNVMKYSDVGDLNFQARVLRKHLKVEITPKDILKLEEENTSSQTSSMHHKSCLEVETQISQDGHKD